MFLLMIFAAIIIFVCGCDQEQEQTSDIDEPETISFVAMDTVIEISAYGENAKEVLLTAEQEVYDLEEMLSATKSSSKVSAINTYGGSDTLSQELTDIMDVTFTVSERSGGAFDISVYPLVKAWGFVDDSYQVPTQSEIDAHLPLVNYQNISYDGSSVSLRDGMAIDLGGIAKGYAGQKLSDIFAKAGIESAMVSLGGNVQVLGTKPDGEKWRIGVQDPLDENGVVCVISIADEAAVTSGGYQRYFDQDGVRYHHIIDPDTGYPADSGLLSTTIVCDNGTMADGLSTALFVLGLDKSIQYWRDYGGFEAVFVTDDHQVMVTEGLADDCEFVGEDSGFTFSTISK